MSTKYIKKFETEVSYDAYINGDPYLPNVSYVEEMNRCFFTAAAVVPEYLTFDVLSSGNIVWKDSKTIQYNKNGGGWTDLAQNGTISVANGDTVMFKGNCTRVNQTGFDGTTCSFNVRGNAFSLLGGDDFASITAATSYAFQSLFQYCNVIDASGLMLPAGEVGSYAYAYMFYGCTGLTHAPIVLPATTVQTSGYEDMFGGGCKNLLDAPEISATTVGQAACREMFTNATKLATGPSILPAATLNMHCYNTMFKGCSSLVESPVLPAESLPNYSYRYMFSGCTSLNKITCLATNISGNLCTQSWVAGVKSGGTFYKNASMSSWTTGVDGIPSGWSRQNA